MYSRNKEQGSLSLYRTTGSVEQASRPFTTGRHHCPVRRKHHFRQRLQNLRFTSSRRQRHHTPSTNQPELRQCSDTNIPRIHDERLSHAVATLRSSKGMHFHCSQTLVSFSSHPSSGPTSRIVNAALRPFSSTFGGTFSHCQRSTLLQYASAIVVAPSSQRCKSSRAEPSRSEPIRVEPNRAEPITSSIPLPNDETPSVFLHNKTISVGPFDKAPTVSGQRHPSILSRLSDRQVSLSYRNGIFIFLPNDDARLSCPQPQTSGLVQMTDTLLSSNPYNRTASFRVNVEPDSSFLNDKAPISDANDKSLRRLEKAYRQGVSRNLGMNQTAASRPVQDCPVRRSLAVRDVPKLHPVPNSLPRDFRSQQGRSPCPNGKAPLPFGFRKASLLN